MYLWNQYSMQTIKHFMELVYRGWNPILLLHDKENNPYVQNRHYQRAHLYVSYACV